MRTEYLEASIFDAANEALRQIGGEPFVRIVRAQAGLRDDDANSTADRPLAEYLAWRDAALHLLGDSFQGVAFEIGRILGRTLRRDRREQIVDLSQTHAGTQDRLYLLGQATVRGARNHPGRVRALLQGADSLAVMASGCFECRELRRQDEFCGIYRGLITELAEGQFGMRVYMAEVACLATGDPLCQIEVRRFR